MRVVIFNANLYTFPTASYWDVCDFLAIHPTSGQMGHVKGSDNLMMEGLQFLLVSSPFSGQIFNVANETLPWDFGTE